MAAVCCPAMPDDVIEFLAGVLLDDSDDVELTEMTRRIN